MSSVIAAHCLSTVTACSALPDAEDAVQETLLRAWRNRDSYRVATNACLESIFVVWFQASSETFQ